MARSLGHEMAVERLFGALYEDLQRQAPTSDAQLRAMLLELTRGLGVSDQEKNIVQVLPVASGLYEQYQGATVGTQFWTEVHGPLWCAVRNAAAAYREFLRMLDTDVEMSDNRWLAYIDQVRRHGGGPLKSKMESRLRAPGSRGGLNKQLPLLPRRASQGGSQSRPPRTARDMGAKVVQDTQQEVNEVDGGRDTYEWRGQTYELPLLADYRDNRDLHRKEYVRFWRQFKGMDCGLPLDYDNTNSADPTKMRRGDARTDHRSDDCAFPWVWPIGTPHLDDPGVMDGPDWLHRAQHLAKHCTAEHSPTYHSQLNVFTKQERRDINMLPYAERAQKISGLARSKEGLDHNYVVDLVQCIEGDEGH